jgi:hypothetical protein
MEAVMSIRQWVAVVCGIALVAGAAGAVGQVGSGAAAGDADGLVQIKSRNFDLAYLRPGADFRGYTKVLFGPTQVAFAGDWLTNMNHNRIAVLQGTSVADADRIAESVRAGLLKVFSDVLGRAGYEIVTAPGPDVLAFSLSVVDLYINAPKTVTQALPSRVYTQDAGHATLTLDIRDAATGVLLGRLVDRRTAGVRSGLRSGLGVTTTVTNQFDFENLFGTWARNGVAVLKSPSPVAMSMRPQASN